MKQEKDKNLIAENIIYSYTQYCYRQTKPPRFPDCFGERELVMTVDVCFEYDIESHRYLVKITMNKDDDITTYEGSSHFENNNNVLDSIVTHIETSHDSDIDDINTKVHDLITKHGSMVKASNIKHGDLND